MIRKRYRRPRVYRRRRYYKRRIARPFKGYARIRFFKLGEILSVTQNSATNVAVYPNDNPNTSQDWSNFADLFDSYRCCAIKLKWIPYVNVSNTKDTTITTEPAAISYQYRNAPVYVFYDYNTVFSSAPTPETVFSYSNCQFNP